MSAQRWSAFALLFAGLLSVPSVAPQRVQAADSDMPKLKFEAYQDAAKDYRWRLKAGNGEILATAGQGYKAKADCMTGIHHIQEEVGSDKLKFEPYEDNAKEFRWRLKATNGQVMATSASGYKIKADCEHAIDLIKKGAGKAEVVEVQEKT